jgi:DNA-binding CsgD family transcriptional regulator
MEMANEPEGEGVAAKRPRTRPTSYAKPTERLMAAAALIGAGMRPEDAAVQLGYSPKSVNGIGQRIKEKGLDKFLTEKRVKTATQVVDTFMRGKPIGRKTKEEIVVEDGKEVRKTVVLEPGVFPKDSTVKDCAMSVLDRAYPKQSEEKPTGVSFTQVNISLCTINNDPAAPQDVVYPQDGAPVDVTPQ